MHILQKIEDVINCRGLIFFHFKVERVYIDVFEMSLLLSGVSLSFVVKKIIIPFIFGWVLYVAKGKMGKDEGNLAFRQCFFEVGTAFHQFSCFFK